MGKDEIADVIKDLDSDKRKFIAEEAVARMDILMEVISHFNGTEKERDKLAGGLGLSRTEFNKMIQQWKEMKKDKNFAETVKQLEEILESGDIVKLKKALVENSAARSQLLTYSLEKAYLTRTNFSEDRGGISILEMTVASYTGAATVSFLLGGPLIMPLVPAAGLVGLLSAAAGQTFLPSRGTSTSLANDLYKFGYLLTPEEIRQRLTTDQEIILPKRPEPKSQGYSGA